MRKFWIAVVLIWIVTGIWSIYNFYKNAERCDYCKELTTEKQTELWDVQVCDKCWSVWSVEAGKLWGNMYNRDRLIWIYHSVGGKREIERWEE